MLFLQKSRPMLKRFLLGACALTIAMPALADEAAAPNSVEPLFKGYNGAFVMHNMSGKPAYEYNAQQTSKLSAPCSTFKIVLALVGLETGVIKDESTIEKWDGKKAEVQTWNRDHNLESAMNESVNWYFQRICTKIGTANMNKYLKLLHYGNEDASSGLDNFWMSDEGSLRISPQQQVAFLEQLYKEKLPLSSRTQKIVKRIMKVDESPKGVLFGKTGTDGVKGKMVAGWFVGYVEGKDDTHIFATNIQADSGATGRKAREISTKILKQLGYW